METTALRLMKGNDAVTTTKRLPIKFQMVPQAYGAWNPWKKRVKPGIVVVKSMESSEKFSAIMAEEVAKELEKEGYWEWREMDNCKGCGEKGGLVELMECLEREAIMGEDEGKDPNDYNRRAHIFDKSSKIFQALNGSSSISV